MSKPEKWLYLNFGRVSDELMQIRKILSFRYGRKIIYTRVCEREEIITNPSYIIIQIRESRMIKNVKCSSVAVKRKGEVFV